MNWLYYQTPEGERHIKKEVVWFIIIFLVSTISFAFGYLAGRELNHPSIVIEKALGPAPR